MKFPRKEKGVTGPSSTTNISSFYLGKLLYLEKMTSEFKKGPAEFKKGQLKPNAIKNT